MKENIVQKLLFYGPFYIKFPLGSVDNGFYSSFSSFLSFFFIAQEAQEAN